MLARLAALAGMIALGGCVPSGEVVSVDSHALTNAADHDGDPAVVAIVSAGDRSALRCTGTLIAERVVLTAAHCGIERDPAAFEVVLGSALGGQGTSILVALAHPAYEDSADHDLALLLLSAPVPAAPALLHTEPITSEPPVRARLVGFGMTQAGAMDDDRKREGWARITEIMPEHVVLGADPSLPCNGDSGGPVFVDTPAGERLAAVISRGDAECSAVGRATRVDAQLETFVQPQLEAWAPGSLAVGARCLYAEHCESGLCAAALDEPAARFCTRACTGDAECPAAMVCDAALCRHPTPSPGALGAPCSSHGECVSGECVDAVGLCSVRCVLGRDACATGFRCEHLDSIDFFCLPEPAPAAGCAIGGTSHRPRGVSWVALALLLVALRRQRRAGPLSTAPRKKVTGAQRSRGRSNGDGEVRESGRVQRGRRGDQEGRRRGIQPVPPLSSATGLLRLP